MLVLVINSGSSSIKFQVLHAGTEQTLASGVVDRIGLEEATLRYNPAGRGPHLESPPILDHSDAVEQILAILADPGRDGVLQDRSELAGVGHRVVHGGERFTGSALIDEKVLAGIRDCADLAPLHNPQNLKGIRACMRVLPDTPQVAVFDTAFHQTMPPVSYLYALPYVIYKRHLVRRYGFHGTSHYYVYQRLLSLTHRAPPERLRVVTCHLGNGASVAAIRGGKVLDTSMGMTPLEGLLMGTRAGDIDPAVPLYLMEKEELSLAQINALLNKHSGLLGISGVSSDMRELGQEAAKGNRQAQLAIDMFCYRLKKYVGAYAAVLGGLDALVFTGGIGQNDAAVRRRTCEGLEFLGVRLDEGRNATAKGSEETLLSPREWPVEVWVVPTNEELVIARETARVLAEAGKK